MSDATKHSRGRRRVVSAGDRLSRSQIALRSNIDRETVTKYLALKGAPKPDDKMRFDYQEALAWIDKNAPRAGAGGDEQKKLRTELLRVQLELAQIQLATEKGESMRKADFGPTISAFMSDLTKNLVDIFEKELPSKLHGLSTVEIAALNAAGIDRVLKRLKAGAAPLVGEAA